MAFDLDAVLAEAPKPRKKHKPFEFTFDGETYRIECDPTRADQLALRAAVNGNSLDALARLLGPVEFERLAKSPKILTGQAVGELLGAYYNALTSGLNAGESSASSTSSRSTARPSKPTSKRTTASRSRS